MNKPYAGNQMKCKRGPVMPRKQGVSSQLSKCSPHVLSLERILIPINRLRLKKREDGELFCFDDTRYKLKAMRKIAPEIIPTLLGLNPILVVKTDRQYHEVLAGSRIFSIAATCLDPMAEIPVLRLDKRFVKKNANLIRYLDLAVVPLLNTLAGNATELYEMFNVDGFREQVWLPPLDSTASSFAEALGIKPSAICWNKKRLKKVGQSTVKSPNTEAA
jgi:hypothetical protein